ncbi:MAG: LptF/LptG family permease [Ignavibacteriae bacterium]|nr:LptF/LptG family permease [Ignavibacteriota bacterium]MCB9214371.1 LptF/LptG family permease [Ignavibacteria bacterium]
MRLTWHILRMHIGPFFFGTAVVVFIFFLQFVFKTLDELVGKDLSYGVIAELYTYNLAWMLVLAVPMGVLFATLMAYGKLSAQNELTIIKSAGGSAFRAMFPAILGGTILFAMLQYFNDQILPETNHKAYVMLTDIKQLRPTAAIEPGQFSSLEGYSILARQVDREKDVLENVTIYQRQGPNLSVLNAGRAEIAYNKDLTKILMTLYDGEAQRINRNNPGEFRRFAFREYQLTINTSGQKFEQTDPTTFGRTDRTMNIAQMQAIVDTSNVHRERAEEELREVIEEQKRLIDSGQVAVASTGMTRSQAAQAALGHLAGIRGELQRISGSIQRARKETNKYLVEIHKKYSIPAACLIFVFVGAPLGIVVRRGNFGVSAVIALGFFVIYWASLVVGEKLADRDILSPALGMWLGDIIVGAMGLYLTILVSRETVMLRLDFPRIKRFLRIFSRKRNVPISPEVS